MKQSNLVLPLKYRLIGEGEESPDLQKVRLYLDGNKEDPKVKQFLNDVRPINEESVSEYLGKDESGKKLFNKLTDKKVSSAVDAFKTKYESETLQKKISEAVAKANPQETEEQKRLREQDEKIARLEERDKISTLKTTALDLMSELKLPFNSLVNSFLGKDEESTIKNIENFNNVWEYKLKEVTEKIKSEISGREEGGDELPKPSTLEKQLEEAKKSKNMVEIVRLKRLIVEARNKKK